MSIRTIFNNLAGAPTTTPATIIDQQFADFANWCVLPCTAVGTNNLILTPFSFVPTLPSYGFLNLFSFVAIATSNAALFAQVGSLPSLPVYASDGITQAGTGTNAVLVGSPYFLQFNPALNGGNGGFFLLPVAQPPISIVPVGAVIMLAALIIPSGYIYCNGQAISRTTYSALFTYSGTTWGPGDGSTTFNVPDMRGWHVRGFDDGAGVDPGRVFATSQQDQVQSHEHNYLGFTGTVAASGAIINAGAGTLTTTGQTGNVGSETRVKNKTFIYAIKF
jgi:microcystin-dependent protein